METLIIKDYEKLNCSVNWNPRYKITVQDLHSNIFELTTKSDAGYVYWLSLSEWNAYNVEYRETKTKYIADYMEFNPTY